MEPQPTQPIAPLPNSAPTSNLQTPSNINPVQPTPPVPKKKSKIWLFILIPVLLLIFVAVLIFVYFLGMRNMAYQNALESVDNADDETLSSPVPEFSYESNCTPLTIGLGKDKTSALFLQETEERGYEGIVRKTIQDGKVYFDIVTNQLPDSGVPYSAWIAYPDKDGNVCEWVSLGDLTKDEQGTGIWTISFGESEYTDDMNVVLITSGKLDTESGYLTSMDDPHVILWGFFGQAGYVEEIQ